MLFRNMINDTKHFFFWPALIISLKKNFAFIGVPEVLSITNHQWSYLMLNTKRTLKHLVEPLYLMKKSYFFIDKKCIWYPNQFYIFCPNNKFLQVNLTIKSQSKSKNKNLCLITVNLFITRHFKTKSKAI